MNLFLIVHNHEPKMVVEMDEDLTSVPQLVRQYCRQTGADAAKVEVYRQKLHRVSMGTNGIKIEPVVGE